MIATQPQQKAFSLISASGAFAAKLKHTCRNVLKRKSFGSRFLSGIFFSKMKSSLSFQVLLHLGSYYFAFFCLIELSLIFYKYIGKTFTKLPLPKSFCKSKSATSLMDSCFDVLSQMTLLEHGQKMVKRGFGDN